MLAWQLPVIFVLFTLASQPASDALPRVTLRASTAQPYVGQVMQLHLDIDLPSPATAEPAQLSIPWLMREFGFTWQLPPDEWLCQRSLATAGLPFQINSSPRLIHLPPRDSTNLHYELSWSLVVREPDVLTSGRIEFAPVRMESRGRSVTSKPLRLQVRRLPLPPSDLPSLNLNLGVGNYQMQATLEPATVSVDEPALLTLKISGEGALAQLPRPALAALPFFRQTSAFFLENSTETWDASGKVRYFRYLLRPRRFGTLTIPNLFYTCFDPALGQYQTRVAPAISLNVVATVKEPVAAAGRNAPGALPGRLRLLRYDDPELRQSSLAGETAWLAIAIAVIAGLPLLVFLVALIRARLGRKSGRWEHRKSAEAARHALHQLHKLDGDVAEIANVVIEFLSQRSPVRTRGADGMDVESALRGPDLSPQRAELLSGFLCACDAARFAPSDPDAAANVRALAERLIRTLSTGT